MPIGSFVKRACIAVIMATLAVAAPATFARDAKAKPGAKAAFDASACYGCHAPIKEFHADGKHKGVGCNACHDGIDKHLADAKARPVTKVDPAACGACHQNQYKTLYTMNWNKPARSEKSQAGGPSPNPAWDKLMMGHGFTREHNLPRSHAYMLLDQYVVDRAFGGRFAPKDGWRYLTQDGGSFKVNSMVTDLYPDNSEHKPFKPGTAAAVNPVCLNCKTQDHILDWAYMGDPVPGAKWSRTSKVNEMVKDVNHSLNCFF